MVGLRSQPCPLPVLQRRWCWRCCQCCRGQVEAARLLRFGLVACSCCGISWGVTAEGIGASSATAALARANTAVPGSSRDAPVTQIVVTLRNLRRSFDDAGRDAERLRAAAKMRCDTTLEHFSADMEAVDLALGRLRADLEEQEARVEEAEGTAQEVRLELALVRALSRTEADLPAAMAENSRRTLTSLEGELEVLLPALAQMQARTSEGKKRLEDRSRTAESMGTFVAALRHSCSFGEKVASVHFAARASEQGSLDNALQALQQLATSPQLLAPPPAVDTQEEPAGGTAGHAVAADTGPMATSPAAIDAAVDGVDALDGEADVEPEDPAGEEGTSPGDEVSFVQLGLKRMVAQHPSVTAVPAGAQDANTDVADMDASGAGGTSAAGAGNGGGAALPPPPLPAGVRQRMGVLEPQIKHMLDQLKASKKQNHDSKRDWCEQEHAHSQLAVRLAHASAGEFASEAEAHAEAQAELGEDLARAQDAVTLVGKTAREFAESASKEQVYLSSSAKDQALATRILRQAIAILAHLPAATSRRSANNPERPVDSAVDALKSAMSSLHMEAQATSGVLQELTNASNAVADSAACAIKDLGRERSSLGFALGAHVSEHARCLESKRMYDAEVQDATAYLQKLAGECASAASGPQDREQRAELRALQDAEELLEGKAIGMGRAVAAGSRGLRGSTAPATRQNLSPLERAAAEMGVAINT